MSKEESLKLLTIAAKYYNDKDTQMNTPALNEEQIEAGYISTTKYTKAQIDEAYNYLLNNSQGETFIDAYKEDMTAQSYFTSTKEQFNNSNYNPNSSVGLEDSSLTFVPTVKVGQTLTTTTKEISPIIIQKVNTVDNFVGYYISIKKDNLPLPNSIKKWTTDNITYDDFNDFYNPSMPASTAIGGSSAIIYDKAREIINSLFNNRENDNEKN